MISTHPDSVINERNFKSCNRLKRIGMLTIVALGLNIMSGVMVAGIDAGKVYNTWPLMNGAFVPSGYWKEKLGLKNFFENLATTQFNHRTFAYVTWALINYAMIKYGRNVH